MARHDAQHGAPIWGRSREGCLCGHIRKVARQAALQCRELLHDDGVGELGWEGRRQQLMIHRGIGSPQMLPGHDEVTARGALERLERGRAVLQGFLSQGGSHSVQRKAQGAQLPTGHAHCNAKSRALNKQTFSLTKPRRWKVLSCAALRVQA